MAPVEVLTFDGEPQVSVYENPRVRRRREAQAVQAARAQDAEDAEDAEEAEDAEDTEAAEDPEDAEDAEPESGHLEGRPGAIRDVHRPAPADVDPRLDLDD